MLIRINPETGTATQIGQGVGFDNIFGLTFQSSATLLPGTSGTVLDPPKLLAVADGDLGETPKLIEIDRQTGQGTLLGSLNTFNGMAGLAANIRLTATRGRLRSFTFDERDGGNECNNVDSSWTYCQHKNGVTHGPGTNVDDTYAWDVNLSQLGDDNADRSKPVYSASPGRIVSFYGAIGPGEGLYNSVLIEHCFVPGPCDCALSPSECWWSRYLHMAEVFVFEGQEVGTEEVIGTIGSVGANNDHLHFAVYEGENRRDATGQGLLVSVDARLVTRAAIFIDGFESGDTSAWSARVP